MFRRDLERVRAERGPGMRVDGTHRSVAFKPSKSPWIAMPKRHGLLPAPQSPDGVHMGFKLGRPSTDANGSTHPEMKQQTGSRTHLEDKLLSLPMQFEHPVARRQWIRRRPWRAMQHVVPAHAAIEHRRTMDRGAKRASKTLDFRQFRHG